MNTLAAILKALESVPKPVIEAVGKLISAVLSSEDPARAAKRAAIVVAGEAASEKAIREGLKKRAKSR